MHCRAANKLVLGNPFLLDKILGRTSTNFDFTAPSPYSCGDDTNADHSRYCLQGYFHFHMMEDVVSKYFMPACMCASAGAQ